MNLNEEFSNQNIGLAMVLPYESSYAILRRLFCCNPSYSQGHNSLFPGTDNIDKLKLTLMGFSYYHSKTFGFNTSALTKEESYSEKKSIYQCPLCAACMFHYEGYNLPWFKICPLHYCDLTKHCPNCGRTWPTTFFTITRGCHVCKWFPSEAFLSQITDGEFRKNIKNSFGEIEMFLKKIDQMPDYFIGYIDSNFGLRLPKFDVKSPYFGASYGHYCKSNKIIRISKFTNFTTVASFVVKSLKTPISNKISYRYKKAKYGKFRALYNIRLSVLTEIVSVIKKESNNTYMFINDPIRLLCKSHINLKKTSIEVLSLKVWFIKVCYIYKNPLICLKHTCWFTNLLMSDNGLSYLINSSSYKILYDLLLKILYLDIYSIISEKVANLRCDTSLENLLKAPNFKHVKPSDYFTVHVKRNILSIIYTDPLKAFKLSDFEEITNQQDFIDEWSEFDDSKRNDYLNIGNLFLSHNARILFKYGNSPNKLIFRLGQP